MSKSQKYIITLVIILIISVAGWVVGTQTLLLKNKNSGVSTSANSNNNPNKWEIYQNEKNGYQFEYPSYLVLSPDSTTDDAIAFWGNDSGVSLAVAVVATNSSSLDEWLKENSGWKFSEKIYITGYGGYLTQGINQDGTLLNEWMAIFLKDKKMFTIVTNLSLTERNRLLQSFRFNDK